MRTKPYFAVTVCLLLGAILSCGEEKYFVKHYRPAKFDIPRKIKKVAVVGFKAKENIGDVVIGKLSNKIQESKRFEIFDRDSLNMILAEKNLQEADLAEENMVKDLKLGAVDALVTGEIRTTWREEAFTETKWEPTITSGGSFSMKPVSVKTLAHVAEITLNIKMLDLHNKAKVIAQQSYTKGFHSKKDKKLIDRLREKRRDEGVTPAGVYELLIDDCVTDFSKLIIPHYEQMPVNLLKGSPLVNQGIVFLKGDNVDDAEMSFRQAMECEPDKVEPVFNLAVCCEAGGKSEEALKLYKKCLMMKPGHTPSMEGINRIKGEERIKEQKNS